MAAINMFRLSLTVLLISSALLTQVSEAFPRDLASKTRAKRQFPGGFSFPAGLGPPSHLFSPLGGGLGGLGVLADFRKCCCRYGVPPECLDKCLVVPGPAPNLPPYCAMYDQTTAFKCFNAADDLRGECAADYEQPPARPGNCPAMLMESDDYLCTVDSCHTDHSCVNRPNAKCCRTTCPDRAAGRNTGKMICLEGVLDTLSRCEQHRHRVLDQIIDANEVVNRSTLLAWLPQCTRREVHAADPQGASYRSTQCIPAAQVCFCVNETTGQEIDGSRYKDGEKPVNCSRLNSRMYSPCRIEALLILEQHASLPMPELMSAVEQGSVWIPTCLHNMAVASGLRTHRHLQCDTTSALCWCTTNAGRAVLDTVMAPGHALFVKECVDFAPTLCEVQVAITVHQYRLSMYGLKNGSQHFQGREFYEELPNFFVHRCAARAKTRGLSIQSTDAAHSFQRVQFTVRKLPMLSERFCVRTKTGVEIEGSRLGAGEHRYVRNTSSTRALCHLRSHCEETVFQLLRTLGQLMLERGAGDLTTLINRQGATSLGHYVPRCEVPETVTAATSKPGQPLEDAIGMYGYAPRQCGALNRTCWCVYRDGQPVGGTLHRRNETVDCSIYQSLCVLPGHSRVHAPTHALRAAMPSCPTGQLCRDIGLHIGIGLCQVESESDRKSCSLNRRTILHGARTLVQPACQLCLCHNGALLGCEQLAKSTCTASQPCFVKTSFGHSMALGDGMRASIDCQDCICQNGKANCKARNCSLPQVALQVTKPCTFPSGFSSEDRVCAPNGRSYPCRESAKSCGGFEDEQLKMGSCSAVNPCQPGSCQDGYRCVPSPRPCLVQPCQQHLCVKADVGCDMPNTPPNSNMAAAQTAADQNGSPEEVCFHGNVSHSSLCHGIVQHGAVQYRGSCAQACAGQVCGSDGVTYPSRCHAHAAVMPVDYTGACETSCDNVECPALERGCTVVTHLPHDCCPFCGAGAILSISKPIAQSLAASGFETANDVTSILVTLHSLLPARTSHHCAVRGHVTNDDVMEMRVEPTRGNAAYSLYCFQATQTIVTSINTGATQQNNAVTAALTLANIQTARTGFSSSAPCLAQLNVVTVLTVLLLTLGMQAL